MVNPDMEPHKAHRERRIVQQHCQGLAFVKAKSLERSERRQLKWLWSVTAKIKQKMTQHSHN